MTLPVRVLTAACVLLLECACSLERPPYGGAREQDLIAAVAAHDVARVGQLLSAGANPNGMVPYEGSSHAPWEYALHQLRPKQPEMVQIVKAMLKSGADPASAWGGRVVRGIARVGDQLPIQIVMLHPDADVVRALMDAGLKPEYAQSALVMAVETGETEIVHLLVDRGVDVNCHPGANTPLVAAIEARNVALMTYLEEHGAREKP